MLQINYVFKWSVSLLQLSRFLLKFWSRTGFGFIRFFHRRSHQILGRSWCCFLWIFLRAVGESLCPCSDASFFFFSVLENVLIWRRCFSTYWSLTCPRAGCVFRISYQGWWTSVRSEPALKYGLQEMGTSLWSIGNRMETQLQTRVLWCLCHKLLSIKQSWLWEWKKHR